MKPKYILIPALFLCCSVQSFAQQQSDSLGMLGDQLNLYGVLDLFKNSDNLEDFEKKLNSENNGVNNLDLNNDGQIDYIQVQDYKDGDGHAIVLRVAINANESQDVAVVEVDKSANGEAHVQIVGDEDLYGKNYIVEPAEENQSVTPTNNNTTVVNNNTTVVVNAWGWRPVQYLYGPSYSVWISPWRWSVYPGWWRPWRPVGWYAYHPRFIRFHPYARVVVVRRSPRIYGVYAPRRVASRVVYNNRVVRPTYYNNGGGRPPQQQQRQNNRQDNRQSGRQQNNGQAAPARQQHSQNNGGQQRVNGGGRHQQSGGGGGGGNRGGRRGR